MNKVDIIYEDYSAIKIKNEILPHMDHQGIMQSELSHIEKHKYHKILYICGI